MDWLIVWRRNVSDGGMEERKVTVWQKNAKVMGWSVEKIQVV